MMYIKSKIAICAAVLIAGVIGLAIYFRSSTPTVSTNVEQYITAKRAKKQAGKTKAEMPELIAQIQRDQRTPNDLSQPSYGPNYTMSAYQKAKKKGRKLKSNDATFTERGPANVAGRTRAIVVYAGDESLNTWLAGSASGGIWKTQDAGQSWIHKTQALPNLATNTLAQSTADPEIVYAGTGEHFTNDFDGAGIFKSTDFGESWTQVADPSIYPDMVNVSRIIVDPADADIAIATTRNSIWADSLEAAIYKTTDGGETWQAMLQSTEMRFDDLDYDPNDFSIQYVAVQGEGVLKSTDGGETWTDSSVGLNPSGRIEITVSPVNTSYIWASAQGGETNTGSDLYISTDGASTWSLLSTEDLTDNVDFLGGQGWYDNIITAHPYDQDVVYVGGVNLWKFELSGDSVSTTRFQTVERETQGFFGLINFGGSIGGGGVDIGDDFEVEELKTVELRFGQGGQKAHRFIVNGRGSGVPPSLYFYQDYVDVPFTAWDVENDVQLMVSFRDQQEDGAWNLISEFTGEPSSDNSREYIYIHDIPYSEEADLNIAMNGGQEHQSLYFLWPVLTNDSPFADNNFPVSSFRIEKNSTSALEKRVKNISDAYFEYDRINTFSSANFQNNEGMHPDQHNITLLIDDPVRKRFRLLIGNDGGLYVSDVSQDPGIFDGVFSYAGFGYNTTQFYSADKAPREDRYIGGMQDNSTWFTPLRVSADATTNYEFAFGGDGFEALWNNRDSRLLLATSQFNGINKSFNGGITWQGVRGDLDDQGPFISRLTNSKQNPDKVYTVGSSGVWRSTDFGSSWQPTRLDSLWSFNNSVEVEVSRSDFNIVWSGGALDENRRLFVSTDGGITFEPTHYYEEKEMGVVTGIATHPTLDSTAFSLFSFQGRPKILRTDDLGQSWYDISGFDLETDESTAGFPDVAVNTLFVFPNDTSRIWAGTEIGIVESLDAGDSWALLETAMGASNVYDMILQDDEIVIATYGRGIWTAEVPGLELDVVLAPSLINSYMQPTGEIFTLIDLFEEYDSTQVLLNEEVVSVITGSAIEEIELILSNPELVGTYPIQLIGYLDGESYPSPVYTINLFVPAQPITTYFNDFSTDSSSMDFVGAGFRIDRPSGFVNEALHSDHPYIDNREIDQTLTKPILIQGDQILSYQDVAIIEPGEAGSVFGDNDFWDYVIVEATTDGVTWIPLLDGYDARYDAQWSDTYDRGGNGSFSMYREHDITLSDFFDQGEIVLLRFRLFADQAANGWGWAIDDVNISEEITSPTIDITTTETKIYPNPATDHINVELDRSLELEQIQIFDMVGRQVYKQELTEDISTHSMTGITPGSYLVVLSNQEDRVVQQIIVE